MPITAARFYVATNSSAEKTANIISIIVPASTELLYTSTNIIADNSISNANTSIIAGTRSTQPELLFPAPIDPHSNSDMFVSSIEYPAKEYATIPIIDVHTQVSTASSKLNSPA